MMKSSELVAKVVDIAKHYKTLYVMGCFGAPLTDTNKSPGTSRTTPIIWRQLVPL